MDVKVIDDLRIRISNEEPRTGDSAYGSGNNDDNSAGDHPMKGQLWEIVNLKIKKGFGVTAPHTEDTLGQTGTGVVTDLVPEVPAVPSAAVPAWTQVLHASSYGFGSGSWYPQADPGTANLGNTLYTEQQTTSVFGGDYQPPLDGSGNIILSTGVDANGNTLTWVEPGVAPTGISEPPANGITGGTNFQSTTALAAVGNVGTPTTIYPNNDYILSKNTSNATGYSTVLAHDIDPDNSGTNSYNTNDWYLVDVEYDDSYEDGVNIPPDGTLGTQGYIAVGHVGSSGSFSLNQQVDPNGVGVYKGSSANSHIGLVPVTRTEYGSTKTVLRAIYQVASDSNANTTAPNLLDEFRLYTQYVGGGIKINKIIVKKLTGSGWVNWLNTNGTSVSDWTVLDGPIGTPHAPVHSFAKRHTYFRSGNLCWEVPTGSTSDIGSQDTHGWEQSFANPPTISPTMWELRFTVTNNPITGAFLGKLRGFIAISLGDPNFEGVYFEEITEVGNYLIKFNFDGATSVGTWTFERADLGTTQYITYATGVIYEASLLSWSHAITADKIHFSTHTTPSEYAISSISLTDSTPIFSGGSAGSWNFDGFNTSLNNYISWDNINFNLVFQECPVADITSPELKFINVNQQIDKTINQYEQYEISFTHGISPGSSATLSIYYYNTNGFGFKISGINSNTAGNTSSDPSAEPFEQIVTIGESEWSSINQEDPAYNADLKNSFVIQVQGTIVDNDLIDGYIDNIIMKRTFSGTDVSDTTVSFSEDVKGWTSFKSFIPDNGVSVSKKYFTFEDGGLYQHYVPLKKDLDPNSTTFNDWITGYTNDNTGNFVKWTAEEADNYNILYGVSYNSTIQAVLNQEPSIVKTFNTINYEGSQTYITNPISISNPDGSVFKTAAEQVDQNNVKAYLAGTNIDGWECSEIKTDLDSGSIKEFIEKEGKWFNYIKGLNVDPTTIDTSLFSTQGIGIIDGVTDITPVENGNGNGGGY